MRNTSSQIKRSKIKPATQEQQIQAARFMGLLGLALVLGFFLTIAFSVNENSKTMAVQGVVTQTFSHTSTSGSDGSKYTTYGHSFQYVDEEGIKRTGQDNGRRQSKYSVGDVVAIGYYPNNPSRIRIHSWFGQWKLQLVLLGLGSFLIYYMFVAVKQTKAGMLLQTPDPLCPN